VAQAKINNLEATLAANNTAIQSVQKELSSVKIQAELDSKSLEVRISHSLEEAATQCSRVEDLLTSNLGMRARLRWAKEHDRTKFRYSQENEPLGRIALRKYRDRTTENGVL
jgi:multidrug resistance efflux pump